MRGRRIIRYAGPVALLGLVCALAGAGVAWGCSCVGPGDPREDVANSDAAIFGEVVAKRISDQGDPRFGGDETDTYTLRVERAYKGE